MVDNNPALTTTSFVTVNENAVMCAIDAARSFATRGGCDEPTGVRIAIIVEELMGNIVEHGACVNGAVVEMTLAMIGDDIALSLQDYGMMFDPRSVSPPHTPPERGGGAGIAMVMAWSRDVTWEHSGGRNHLRLIIRHYD